MVRRILGAMALTPALALGQSSTVGTPGDTTGPIGLVEIQQVLASPGVQFATAEPRARLQSTGGAAPLQDSAEQRNFSQRIDFSELPQGSSVSNQYRDRGILFEGSGPVITEDAGSTSSPVLAGTPAFEGDVAGRFVIPGTDQPAPVYQFHWEIGHFDALQSVQMDLYAPDGSLLASHVNSGTGYYRYVARGGNIGIASWRFHALGTEIDGFGIDNLYFSIPGKADLGREMGVTECSLGNPVNAATGNKFEWETDYLGSRPFPLAIRRAYNSTSGSWTFFPKVTHIPGTIEARVTRPDGKIVTFTDARGSADWRTSSTEVTDALASDLDGAGNIIGWRYRTLDDVEELYDAQGRLPQLTQRSGINQRYGYAQGQITVQHSLGGTITYTLDGTGRITGALDPAGQGYSYTYSANGMLAAVTYPDGSARRSYHYENPAHPDLLTGITDARGNRYATWTYDATRRAISSEHAGGADRTLFDYSDLTSPGISSATVTNPLGKQTTYYYTRVNGVQRVFHIEGHASDNCVAANRRYEYDSRAFVRSRTDWEGNRTEYLRDDRGRELIRREAVGTPVQREIRTDWHSVFNLPTRVTEPGRETLFSYDSNGNLLEKTVRETTPP